MVLYKTATVAILANTIIGENSHQRIFRPAHQESSMGKLSTHVLDISSGKPGVGVALELYLVEATGKTLLKSAVTNQDGRCDAPLLEGASLKVGHYELVFAAGDYFDGQGLTLPSPKFIDRVTLAFGIADTTQNYHVPLVVSPWAYSTYRGS
jgi:5-hydroxyisourate hydrolase